MPTQYTHQRTSRTPYSPALRLARFWARVDTSAGEIGCWPWLGYKNARGYGQVRIEGRRLYPAYRFAWESVNGPMDKAFEARHTCDNPPCCNPLHIEPGTHADNLADMKARGRHWRANQTHCVNGHPFDYVDGKGTRRCSICRRIAVAKYDAKRRGMVTNGMP